MSVAAPAPLKVPRRRRGESLAHYRLADKLCFLACWASGILLCLIAASIVLYMLYRGVQNLSLHMLFSRPQVDADQSKAGGFLDPLIGTLLLTTIGVVIAVPLAVCAAVWYVEYGRPTWLARMVESAIEVVAGTPTIVLAIFGLLLFQNGIFGWMSFTAEGGAVFGRSFLTAGAMMSLIALPLVFAATREGLQGIPQHIREASYGLGKTKIATIRRVLLPAVRPNIGTGAALGMGRIAGDTAIVVILLGATLQLSKEGSIPVISQLRGTGSTLTSYVYNNSPAGEGNAPGKAYAAAFVLLVIVIGLNFVVTFIAKRGSRYGYQGAR
jgi:phosphate transport system permease protein